MSASAETGLFLDGLRCAGCVHRVERELRETPGVAAASVDYTTGRALVRHDPERSGSADLVARVEGLGYSAVPYDPSSLERPATTESREALVRVLVAAFLAGNVMVISAALYIGAYEGMGATTRSALRWLAIALSLPAITWCGLPFWRGALSGLRRGEIPMDVPVVLGMVTAFGASVAGTLAGSTHLYMDSAAMIVFLILLGRTLERRARARAASAVERLAALSPATALRLGRDGVEEVAVAELRIGDRVRVPPGQNIPADGRIVGMATEVDESLLTGESAAVLRETGDPVTGGTRNLLSETEVEVTAPVDGGTLAKLVALLERAQAQRPRLQRLADRVARVFAPGVLAVAAVTALALAFSGADPLEIALTAAAVLIVACPCALGLATPAAVTAAVGRAASLGILVKAGEALERCAATDTLVLDKTGTLTTGRLAVEEIRPDEGTDPDTLLGLAATTEGASTHPLAVAIRGAAERRGLAWEEATPRRALAGRGVEAGAGGAILRVGSRGWLASEGASASPGLDEAGQKLADRGLSLAWVARGGRILGVLGLSDPLREDAARAIDRLRRLDLEVELLSGDQPGAAHLAASRAGIDRVAAGVSPEEKVARVEELRAAGHRVLVAGDGINDAAALAAGHVGVAMASGSDVALHAADAVIRAPQLGALADLVGLSRSTFARIRENLGFALLYNLVAIPLAACGILTPLGAAVAMSLSSLVVTGNAVRLLGWRPRP